MNPRSMLQPTPSQPLRDDEEYPRPSDGCTPLRPGGTAIGTPVVALPVNKSGWNESTIVAAGGGALPAETVEVPKRAACALFGKHNVRNIMIPATKGNCVASSARVRSH